jgi:hypothetical protein
VDKARYLVKANVLEGRSVSEPAAAHGMHRSWIYRLLACYRSGAYEDLESRCGPAHRYPAQLRKGHNSSAAPTPPARLDRLADPAQMQSSTPLRGDLARRSRGPCHRPQPPRRGSPHHLGRHQKRDKATPTPSKTGSEIMPVATWKAQHMSRKSSKSLARGDMWQPGGPRPRVPHTLRTCTVLSMR